MPDVAVPAAPPLANLRRVELVHTGSWQISSGSWNPSREDLVRAVAALECPAVRRPVLKLGHSQGEVPLWAGNPTGAPAVGWVDNLALTNQGHTLVGDYVGMPGWFAGIAASAYPDRSVEGKYDFQCQIGHTHPFVLTAVALLGVTPPGVGTLKSLQDVGALFGVEASSDSGTLVVARFDPDQARWPADAPNGLGGQWRDETPSGSGRGGSGLARRIRLAQGESLAGSGVADGADEGVVPFAVVRTPTGPRLRIGVGIADEDRNRWSAADRGSTANLDAGSAAEFVDSIPQLVEIGEQGNRRRRDLEQRADVLAERRRELIRSQYGDLDPARAGELDALDAQIEQADADIAALERRQRERIDRLSPDFRSEYDSLTRRIAQAGSERDELIAEYWEGGGTDRDLLRRYSDIDMQVQDLLEERRATVLGRSVEELRELDELDRGSRLSPEQRRRRADLRVAQSGLGDSPDVSSEDAFRFFERDAGRLATQRRERDNAQAQRAELAGEATPLSTADAAELAEVTAESRQAEQELLDLIDGGVLAEGAFPGEWADLTYRVEMSEDGPRYVLGARHAGGGEDAETELSEADLRQLGKEIGALLDETRSAVPVAAGSTGRPGEVHAHMPGKHDQSSHGRRYGPDGKPIRRLTRGGRRPAVRTLNRLLGDLEDEQAATRTGISGGPLVDLVRGIRDGVDTEQFTPDQALQLLSMLVFRPDVANNPALSTALARATGELRDGERRDTTPTPDPVPQSAPDPEPVVPEPVALEPPVPTPPVARPPRPAPGPTPPDGGNAGLVARLRSSGSRDAARSMLDGLSVSQLKNVAREANIAFAQNTRKQDLLNLIVQWTVGRRLDSDAISRPAPSRIDAAVDEGDSNLKRYWTQNPEGLAKWVGKPHPWTSLFRQLREHVGSERAKRIAAEWFHERFGYWPGDKRHRDRVKASAPDAVDWPLHDEEAMTLPNPTPTVIHAAAQVTVDDVRTAFYRQASERTWIREFSAEPRELIVADDGSGGVARVAFDVADDGTITFSPPRKVRVAYVEDDEDHAVAASRMVYASAAESRPSIVTAHTVVPEAPDQPFADADDGDEPPEPPAAEPDQPINEEDDMSLTEVRQRLGLADDAEETAVLAAIDELKTKADSAPDPTTIAAAAAENATLTEKVTLLQEQVAGLSKQIADDNAAKAAEVKASVIDEAVTKGRITPADKDKWAERYDRAPDAVTDVLASIADGTAVPVSVIGKAGDPMAAADDLPEEPAWLYGPNEPALAGKE